MLRVVLADDDRTMRQKLMADLSRYPGGCEVLAECTDGSAAIKATLEKNPDVTLMDVVMSPMGGLDAAKELRAQGRKVILLTSSGQGGVVQGWPHLIKPYSAPMLFFKVSQVLAGL